jgi:hypothetical protein
VAEFFHGKHRAPSSNPSIVKKEGGVRRERGREERKKSKI